MECALGIKDLKTSPEKETLENRLEKDSVKRRIRENYCDDKRKKRTHESSQHYRQQQQSRDFFVIGQDIATDSLKELSKYLMTRDYENVAEFDGCDDGKVGVITIPEKYIPKKPNVVDLEKEDIVKQSFPENKKLHVSFLS